MPYPLANGVHPHLSGHGPKRFNRDFSFTHRLMPQRKKSLYFNGDAAHSFHAERSPLARFFYP
jgi:hypothetical protein